jgi:endonuclease-3
MAESAEQKKKRARRVYRKLAKQYPDATRALLHRNPYQLLVATILSAQCTDERVNMTTPTLFEKYPDPQALAASRPADVEKIIKSCGFYRNKTKSIRGAAQAIVDEHDGEVPQTMDELLKLPGVARKTANVVLGNAFDTNVGVVVDTHVKRLSNRLGFTDQKTPEKIEQDLMPLFPKKNWTMLSHLLIFHGRATCKARKPDCDNCVVNKDCPKIGVADHD